MNKEVEIPPPRRSKVPPHRGQAGEAAERCERRMVRKHVVGEPLMHGHRCAGEKAGLHVPKA
jgi:hypothetical protein